MDIYFPEGVDPTEAPALDFPRPLRAMVIFLHGAGLHGSPVGSDLLSYSPFLQALADKGYIVAAPTLPGHGLSPGRRGEFRLEDYAAITEASLQYLNEFFSFGRLKTFLVGWSQGGIGATAAVDRLWQKLAGAFIHFVARPQYPEVLKVVRYPGDIWQQALIRIQHLALVRSRLAQKFLSRCHWPILSYLPLRQIATPEQMAALKEDEDIVSAYTFGALLSLLDTPIGDLSRVKIPVGVFRPEDDIGEEAYQAEMAQAFGNGQFIKAPGNHGMIHYEPERLAGCVDEFITKHLK